MKEGTIDRFGGVVMGHGKRGGTRRDVSKTRDTSHKSRVLVVWS